MFLMTQPLFPAPETNRHEIHIWDPLPAWPFPVAGTEPSLSVHRNEGGTGGFLSSEEAPAHLSIADGFLQEETPKVHKNLHSNLPSTELKKSPS